ncbi:uncharacterized protein MICPUCDRAFT_51147 [Micromonas pusilla CCMP1545]|jgi:dienelactone hydrolase|uniref:Predicted protein n=1 Tax=Micromonas pusilla (strain CCMP1545) TaxID=564608 RepID=C1N0T9_MICPC|nr:uncharacterized protein MICPUCDRAFT_51147 [Micromonas pusilla CCMP1545]EEH54325.1 predicted protein [Micromonas pusilla CCMP1545]|eukprot:XP_003061695.1 predicted protein [Micromonas pusilla CCMP1545]
MSSSSPSTDARVFDAGVPVSQLPWGADLARVSSSIASRDLEYADDDVPLRGYASFDARAVEETRKRGATGTGGGGLDGVVVLHTAIGPGEVFVRSCVDALASLGYAAAALDMFGLPECVFDAETRETAFGALRRDRSSAAKRVAAGVRALEAQPECGGVRCVVGFCLGGRCALDLARSGFGASVRGVVSFHGILDDPSDEGLPRSAVAANPPSVLIFHGEEDPFSTAAAKEACLADLRARGVATEFHGFPGVKHGFTRPEKTTEEDARAGFGYDAAAAEKSWTRCKAFIAETCE